MMENYLEIPPLFLPRQVIVHPAASGEFSKLFIGSVLWRHLRGDWGDFPVAYYEDLRDGDPLNCLYRYGYLFRWLHVQTSGDRQTTAVRVPHVGGNRGEKGELLHVPPDRFEFLDEPFQFAKLDWDEPE